MKEIVENYDDFWEYTRNEKNKYGSEDFDTRGYKGGIYIGVVYRFE